MSAERVQFVISAEDDGAAVFERLSSIERPAWPRLSKATAWTRAGLRILHAHSVRGSEVEWVHVKGRKSSKPLQPRAPEGLSNFKVDVLLNESDRQRLQVLERAVPASSQAMIMRTAVHFLAQLGALLGRGGDLMLTTHGTMQGRVDLSAIALDKGPPADAGVFRLHGPRAMTAAPLKTAGAIDPPGSPEIDTFFSVIWLVGTFNRASVTSVDDVTREALRASQEWSERRPEAVAEQRRECERRWELKLDLVRLFAEFWREEEDALRKRDGSRLLAILKGHRLLPDSWCRRVGKAPEVYAHRGAEALRAYLTSRFAKLHPWQGGQQEAPRSEGGDCATRWRFWTQSRPAHGDWREVRAALDWTAVMHHWLSNRPGGRAELAAHDLQALMVDAFGARNSRHTGPLAESCSRFNKAFYDDAVLSGYRALEESDRVLNIGELLKTLEVPIGEDGTEPTSVGDDERKNFARLVYLGLNIARVIQPVYRWRASANEVVDFFKVEVGVRSRAYADFAELQARIFGAQTALGGLHWILHGGIVPRANRGRVWLLTGEPGSGKSTCGLAIAADMARRGRVSVLVCSDERANTVHERLDTFGLHDPARYTLIPYDELEDQLRADTEALLAEEPPANSAAPRVKGLLVIVGAFRDATKTGDGSYQLDLSTWLRTMSQSSRTFCAACVQAEKTTEDSERKARLRALARKWRWISIVIDSIDTLETDVPDLARVGQDEGQDHRALMTRLVREVEASRIWAILLCGKHNPRRMPLTYLADTVIELNSDASRLRRTLQVVKCRSQAYDPGEHTMQIVERAGVVLHPNLASIQRVTRRRTTRPIDKKHVFPLPSRLLWGDPSTELPPLEEQLPVKQFSIRRGSKVLFHGPPQSGKMPLLMDLVSERLVLSEYPLWRLGATGAVLVVSFRANPQECLRPLQESPRLAAKWRKNVSDIQLQWYGVDDTLCPAQIAHELVRRIQRSKRDGVPIDWIVFLGVDALSTNLPLVYGDRAFWPTVLAVTASEEITTAFVVVDSQDRFVSQHKLDMDYVLRFSPAPGGGPRSIEIEKSADLPSPEGYPRLLLSLRDRTVTCASTSATARAVPRSR